jgi:hypothetical protein
MEATDPFIPAFPTDDSLRVELPEQWMSPFPTMSVDAHEETAANSAEPQAAPAVTGETSVPFGASEPETPAATNGRSAGESVDRARDLAKHLAGALQELQQSLDATASERERFLDERAQLQERIRSLEREADHKRRFQETLTSGTGASITSEDLQALQTMTDALNQDPDRLTVLFNVVQQASKLAAVVTLFGQLRRMAEEV